MTLPFSLRVIRYILLAFMCLLAVAAVLLLRRNAGFPADDQISLPAATWLAWLIAAWWVLPACLWRDPRLITTFRNFFGIFWVLMAARGVAQITAVYIQGWWYPAYAITHALFCLGQLLWLRAQVRRQRAEDAGSTSGATFHASHFATTLAVSLVVEICYTGILLRSGAWDERIFFASSSPSWGLLNLVTAMALCFLVPDLAVVLWKLYGPGAVSPPSARHLSKWQRLRTAAAMATVAVVVTALAGWMWMDRLDSEADRFGRVGFEIYESLSEFEEHFQLGDETAMAEFIVGGDASWTAEQTQAEPFSIWRWQEGGPPRTLLQTITDWRRDIDDVLQVAFKIHLLDEVLSEHEALLRLRFEVTGRHSSDYGLLHVRMIRDDDGDVYRWRIADSELLEGWSVEGPGDHFVDAAARAGLDFTMEPDRRFAPHEECSSPAECDGPSELRFETMRHAYAGAAVADFDGDGWDDVFLGSGGRPALFRNVGTADLVGRRFEEVTTGQPFADLWHVNVAGFADFDNDGDQDLFLGAYFGRNYLFENDGTGRFIEVTDPGFQDLDLITVFSFFDYDADGDLDIYLGRYLDARTEIPDSFLYARNGMPDRLYENLGGLRFRDVSAEAGIGDEGLALSLAAADYDNDGDQDLYVANDFGRNTMYQNQGDGTFRDVSLASRSFAIGGSMSASWGDYDNDGLLDLYVAAIRSNQRWFVQPITARRIVVKFLREGRLGPPGPLLADLKTHMGDQWKEIGNFALAGNYLLRQNADGTFTDRAHAAAARPAGWYWSSAFLDFDHDGDLDIYATDGWITGKKIHDL
ncbi:MAG: VCBS repeat-containing protein [Thermoanaerobaculia bacterium]|nr:VCBS repeat-containing protein [Thermoanaerobaculia bacterium]